MRSRPGKKAALVALVATVGSAGLLWLADAGEAEEPQKAGTEGGSAPASQRSIAGVPLTADEAARSAREFFAGADAHRERIRSHQRAELEAAVAYAQELIERALVLREQTLRFASDLSDQRASGAPLSGAQLDLLREGTRQHLALHDEMRALIDQYASWSTLSDARLPLIGPDERTKATLLSLSAALVLYDNLALAVLSFQDAGDLRRLINRPDSAFALDRDQMLRIVRDYRDPDKRARVRSALDALGTQAAEITRLGATDPQIEYLAALIEQSPSAQRLEQQTSWGDYAKVFGMLSLEGFDQIDKLSDESLGVLSKVFGNTVGLVQTRRGKLFAREDVVEDLEATLEPLDILLERTPFRLTDKFIPGHYGHVAIWLGDATDLERAGLWDHPAIVPHRGDILAGRRIVEALRSGVTLSSLEKFLDVDDLAVLRRTDLDDALRVRTWISSLSQVGKAYDFNFDVETTDKIVCSELVYLTFGDVPWPTDLVLNRPTISPDHVAQMALEGGPLALVRMYEAGRRIEGEGMTGIYEARLLGAP